ncbi:MAG: hypothetical protein WCD86_08805, partial [Ktedonobacteraceae bacterium]
MKEEKREERVGSLKRRLMVFLTDMTSRRIFGQEKTTIDFRACMDTGKILLVKLDRQRPELSGLIGATIVARIAMAAYSRTTIPEEKRVPFALYCDEYQRFSTPT